MRGPIKSVAPRRFGRLGAALQPRFGNLEAQISQIGFATRIGRSTRRNAPKRGLDDSCVDGCLKNKAGLMAALSIRASQWTANNCPSCPNCCPNCCPKLRAMAGIYQDFSQSLRRSPSPPPTAYNPRNYDPSPPKAAPRPRPRRAPPTRAPRRSRSKKKEWKNAWTQRALTPQTLSPPPRADRAPSARSPPPELPRPLPPQPPYPIPPVSAFPSSSST